MRNIFLFCLFLQSSVYARFLYATKPYVQMHQNKSRYSRVISNFECNQPFKMIKDHGEFFEVSYAAYKGFILRELVSSSKAKDCPQDKYSKFFEYLQLDISDMHYWGRVQDLYIYGEVNP
ncbi:MAG: hypothetical protein CME69_04495 [Halobacteriovorax sp.]|nr:hypothetical protein [Halobacteriovorax sp.]